MAPSDLPRPPAAATPRSQGSPSQADEVRPGRILVADDDRITRDMLSSILRGAGHTVEPVEDGQEAIERIAQGGIELVLLDIVMPRLSGLEACRILKGMATDVFVPVVLVTVKTDTASRVEGLKIGADDYVCKPFEEQELLARVGAMLRIKRLHEHIASQRAKLERLSVLDEMTGLYNYRYLNTRLGEEFKRAERHHEPFSCVVIDIDHLKAHNERAGRAAGDAIIKTIADRIRRCVRDIDVVARYGGEEFLVMLPSTHFAGSIAAAERIWRAISEHPIEADGKTHAVDVSMGVALYPSRDVRTREALLRAADVALSQAKREGGNRICVFQQQGYVYSPEIDPGTKRSSSAPPSQSKRMER